VVSDPRIDLVVLRTRSGGAPCITAPAKRSSESSDEARRVAKI
jgi:hypothetical protein